MRGLTSWLTALLVGLLSSHDPATAGAEESADRLADLKQLAEKLASEDPGERRDAAGLVFGMVKPRHAFEPGETVYFEGDELDFVVRKIVPLLVGVLDDPGARGIAARTIRFLTMQRAFDAFVRANPGLHIIPDAGPLIRAVQEPDGEDAYSAFRYVAVPFSSAVIETLRKGLQRGRRVHVVARALAVGGPEARRVLIDELTQPSKYESIKVSAGAALGEVALEPTEVQILVGIATRCEYEVSRSIALHALRGSRLAPEAASKLIPLLDDPLPLVRSSAAVVLALAGRRDLLPRFSALLGTPAEDGAVEAIAIVGASRTLVPDLVRVVENDGAAWQTRVQAIRALAGLGAEAKGALPAIELRAEGDPDDEAASDETIEARKAVLSITRALREGAGKR